MNAAQGDIDASVFDWPAIVGIDHRFDDLMFEVAFFAAVRGHFQRIQNGRISRPAYAAFGHPDGQLKLSKNSGYNPWMFAIAPFSDFTVMAKAVFRIILSDMAPETLANFARQNDGAVMTQALGNQIVITC